MGRYAADEFYFIRKRMLRNRVEEACRKAELASGAIPDEILLSAGFTPEEIKGLGQQRTLPLNQTDLLT